MTEHAGGSTPAGPERRQAPEIEDFLSRAVDRQVAQQRALADALSELRQAVDALATRDSVPDETHVALASALGDLRDAVHELTSHARQPVDVSGLEKVIRDISEGEMSFMVRELKDLKESSSGGDSIETTERLRDLNHDVDTVRDAVGGVAADIDGIAQALIDLNSGLRGWADGVDSNIASLRDAVDRVHEVAIESQELLAPDGEDGEGRSERVGVAAMGERIQGIEDRVADTAELSSYLTEQVESLDKLLTRIGDLPMKLEGVVAQALRRTLATRAKLDKEAERAIDDVLGSVDQQLEQFNASLQRVSTNDDRLEKIEAGQSELRSQFEDLQKAFAGKFEALAQALDRSAKGLTPRALDSLNKPVRRRTSKSASSKTAGPKRKAKAKPSELKPVPKSRGTAKRKPSRRRISPPIIELDDESLE